MTVLDIDAESVTTINWVRLGERIVVELFVGIVPTESETLRPSCVTGYFPEVCIASILMIGCSFVVSGDRSIQSSF